MMSKSQILKKIGNIIEELSEQQQYLANTNKINLLELELFTANADFLTDHIEILKKLNDRRYEADEPNLPVSKPSPKNEQKPEPEAEKEPLSVPDEEEKEKKFSFSFDEEPTEMIFDFEKKIAVEEVFDRPLNDDERRLLEEKSSAPAAKPEEFIVLDTDQKDEDVKADDEDIEPFLMVREQVAKSDQASARTASEEIKEVEPETNSTASSKLKPLNEQPLNQKSEISQSVEDKAEEKPVTVSKHAEGGASVGRNPLVQKDERPLTLNEMLSAKLGQSAGQNTQRPSKKLEDLKVAISINDKMVFIKELFNGYNLAYSEAIEIVNRFESFDAADNFLQKNYSVKNDWESKQITVARFYEYLHKKFVM